MKGILVIEILGISGSGKTFYYNLIKDQLEKKLIKKNKFFKTSKSINLLSTIIIEILTLPRNLILLLSIFDYFIDYEHKRNLKSLFKRFFKIYIVYLNSRIHKIFINKLMIIESITHLSINSNKKDHKIFLETLKKLYRTKELIFLYLDSDIDLSLERMKLRGDNVEKLYYSRLRRYKMSAIFHKNLLSETMYNNKNGRVISSLYINSESNQKKSFKEIKNWLKSLSP